MSKKTKQTKIKKGKTQSQKQKQSQNIEKKQLQQQQSQNIEVNITQPKSKSRSYKPRLQNIEKEQPQQPQQPQQQTISNIPIPIPIPIYNQMPSQYIRQEEGISELLKQLLKTTTQPILSPPQPLLLPPPPSPQLIAEPIMRAFGVPLMQSAEPIIPIFDDRPGIRIPQLQPPEQSLLSPPPSPSPLRQLRPPPPSPSPLRQLSQLPPQNYKFKSDIFESDSDSDFYNVKSFDKPRSFDSSNKFSKRVTERIPIDVIPSFEKTTKENIPIAFLPNKDETLLNTINRDNNQDTLDKINLFNPSKITLSVNKITKPTIPFEESDLPTTVISKRIPDTSNESLLQKLNNSKNDEIAEENKIIKEAEEISKNTRLDVIKAKDEIDDAKEKLTELQQQNYLKVENAQKLFDKSFMGNSKFSTEQNNARRKLINIMYENQKNIIKNKTNYPEKLEEIYKTIKTYNNLDVKVNSPLELDNLLKSYFNEYSLNLISIENAKKELEEKKAKQAQLSSESKIVEKITEDLRDSILEKRDIELALLRKKADEDAKKAEEDAKKAEEDAKKAEEDAKKAEEIKQAKIQANEAKIIEDFTKVRDIIAKSANKMRQIDRNEIKKLSTSQKEKWKISENDAKVINKYLILINPKGTLANTRYYDRVDDLLNKILNPSEEINI